MDACQTQSQRSCSVQLSGALVKRHFSRRTLWRLLDTAWRVHQKTEASRILANWPGNVVFFSLLQACPPPTAPSTLRDCCEAWMTVTLPGSKLIVSSGPQVKSRHPGLAVTVPCLPRHQPVFKLWPHWSQGCPLSAWTLSPHHQTPHLHHLHQGHQVRQ